METWSRRQLGEGRKASPTEPLKGARFLGNPLIPDFWPLELFEKELCVFKPQVGVLCSSSPRTQNGPFPPAHLAPSAQHCPDHPGGPQPLLSTQFPSFSAKSFSLRQIERTGIPVAVSNGGHIRLYLGGLFHWLCCWSWRSSQAFFILLWPLLTSFNPYRSAQPHPRGCFLATVPLSLACWGGAAQLCFQLPAAQ